MNGVEVNNEITVIKALLIIASPPQLFDSLILKSILAGSTLNIKPTTDIQMTQILEGGTPKHSIVL